MAKDSVSLEQLRQRTSAADLTGFERVAGGTEIRRVGTAKDGVPKNGNGPNPGGAQG